MATGDQSDLETRIFGQLPPWFGDAVNDPILSGHLSGAGFVLSWVYQLIYFLKSMMRLATQFGGFIDMTAYDFFGTAFMRLTGELDSHFISRIQTEIFRPRVTVAAIEEALVELTGNEPIIFEQWNPEDTGAYDVPQTMGYDVAGRLGSYDLTNQVLVQAFNAQGQGIPNVAGYDTGGAGGYDSGGIEYIDPAQVVGPVTTEDIVQIVERTRAAGTVVWLQINP